MAKKAFEGLTETMFYVLMAFLKRSMCGTEAVDFVERKTRGRVRIGPGTLYTILGRFEREKLVREVCVEGRRRTYAITEKGRQIYLEELERIRQCVLDGDSEWDEEADGNV